MKHLLQVLIMVLTVVAIASPSYAGDEHKDNKYKKDKKEQFHDSNNDKHKMKKRHRKGGLPRCETELAECLINLTENENMLQVCENDLALCQATEGQVFPATGQTSCWNSSGGLIDCAGTGHDGDIQAGADLSYTGTGHTIIDNNTKLEWMKQDDNNGGCASYPGNLDKDCTFTWDEAFMFVANLNANNHAGGGWRMPNAKELQSIVNYENSLPSPAVSEAFNAGCVAGCTVETCSCTAASSYWSSTSHAFNPLFAWDVFFSTGAVGDRGKSLDFGRMRAVRGGL